GGPTQAYPVSHSTLQLTHSGSSPTSKVGSQVLTSTLRSEWNKSSPVSSSHTLLELGGSAVQPTGRSTERKPQPRRVTERGDPLQASLSAGIAQSCLLQYSCG